MVGTIRKNIMFFFTCVCIASIVHAGNDEELFLRGNKYYAQKNYANALQAYEMIAHKGVAVLYNMGNCAFHQEDYSHALVYWNRAQNGATAHEYNLIERNKKSVFAKIGTEPQRASWDSFIRWLRAYMLVSIFILQLIFLMLWWLFLFVLRKQTSIARIMRACICLTMLFCASLLTMHYMQQNVHQAIIVTKEGRLLTGPDKNFPVLSSLNYAHNVKVKESREGWYKIQYADMMGWVEADVIQII
jgi:tetratricopeptide (TPR) repeat protein